jgi:putative transposase
MAVMGLAGVLRGKKVRTTISRKAVAAGDHVNRQFVAERPDQLWVADFTYVSTWRGFVYVAFIIDVFAGYIVGWRVSSSMETTFVPDALEQALWARRPSGTVHHSDKGSQYVSLAYTQRLKEAGLLASTGSTGDSYDNAMAESINGLYKAEVIHRKSWKNRATWRSHVSGSIPLSLQLPIRLYITAALSVVGWRTASPVLRKGPSG